VSEAVEGTGERQAAGSGDWPAPPETLPTQPAEINDSALPEIHASEPSQRTALDFTALMPLPPAAPPRRRRPSRRTAFVSVLILLLAATTVAASVLAYRNAQQAADWEDRAETVEANAAKLNELLVERSQALNQRTRDLNESAAAIRDARAALRRSESDVASLASRQRELANEKAQVEDEREQLEVQRVALEGVAGSYITCKSGLVDLVGAVARSDWYWVDYYYDGIEADCASAESALDSYLYSYGGE
jgi:cell division protein FtsB